MKKLLAIFLGIVYLTISIGFPISVHHCNSAGETTFSFGQTNVCNCQLEVVNSCCSIEETKSASACQHMIDSQPCCTFESYTIIWESNQQLPSDKLENLQVKELVVFETEQLIQEENEDNSVKSFHYKPPPKKSESVLILRNQFVFYG